MKRRLRMKSFLWSDTRFWVYSFLRVMWVLKNWWDNLFGLWELVMNVLIWAI